jgi:hypothetical protein
VIRAVGVHRLVDDERLVVAEVPVREPVHETVGERVEQLARARLRNARAVAA